jgi:ornithine cyclodeaminase/alanine dehydrogenase-like protein (mu-crystallin family)
VATRQGETSVLILGRAEVEEVLRINEIAQVVEDSYRALALGSASLFYVVREELPGNALFGLRSAVWPDHNLLGFKVSGFFPNNHSVGMESHQAFVMLLDMATGRPTAFVDGNYVTWIRTSAAVLVGTLALARPDARRVLVVGTGVQAEAQIMGQSWGLAERDPEFSAFEPLDDAAGTRAHAFAERMSARGLSVSAVSDLPGAVAQADIIITVTPSGQPLIKGDWVSPGTHINAVGSDSPGKRELDDDLLQKGRIVADDRGQATRLGEAQYLAPDGASRLSTIGDVLTGKAEPRSSQDEVTIFDTTGLAIHDVATADVVRQRAIAAGTGLWLDL